jgi:hypothetical protein
MIEVLFLLISLVKASHKQIILRLGGNVELDEEELEREKHEKEKRKKKDLKVEVKKLHVSISIKYIILISNYIINQIHNLYNCVVQKQ